MQMTLDNLLKNIEDYRPQLNISRIEGILIKTVKMLENNQPTFDPHCLYIGKASSLPISLPENGPINLLCISDSCLPEGYSRNSCLNLILLLDNRLDIARVFNRVQEVYIQHQQLELISSRLLDTLSQNKGIMHILDAAYELLGYPVALVDFSFKLIAMTKNVELEDPMWNELKTKGYFSNYTMSVLRERRYVELLSQLKTPTLLVYDVFNTIHMVCNITVDHKIIGILGVFGSEGFFDDNAYQIASLLSNVISIEMQKDKSFLNNKIFTYEYFISDLLDGVISDRVTIEERIKCLDLHFKENFHVMAINISQNDTLNTPFQHIRNTLEDIVKGSKSIFYKENIVMLISRSKKISQQDHDIKNLKEFLKANRLFCGLSRCFEDIADIREYYQQSLESILLGTYMERDESFFAYEDYAIFHLFKLRSNHNNLKRFCHSSVFTLIKYDQTNRTNFVECLHKYLLNEKKQVETAAALGIHRSTLAYRINNIEKIMGINLNDIDTAFHILLSFKILEFINKDKEFLKI